MVYTWLVGLGGIVEVHLSVAEGVVAAVGGEPLVGGAVVDEHAAIVGQKDVAVGGEAIELCVLGVGVVGADSQQLDAIVVEVGIAYPVPPLMDEGRAVGRASPVGGHIAGAVDEYGAVLDKGGTGGLAPVEVDFCSTGPCLLDLSEESVYGVLVQVVAIREAQVHEAAAEVVGIVVVVIGGSVKVELAILLFVSGIDLLEEAGPVPSLLEGNISAYREA